MPDARDPLSAPSPWYVLVELSSGSNGDELNALLETSFAGAIERELVSDAVIAQSDTQRAAFWQVREAMSDAQRHEGGSIKHDVSVPISNITRFLERAIEAVQ